MTDKERQKRAVHLSTEGYIIVFFVLIFAAILTMKYVPFGFIPGGAIIVYVFYNFPTVIRMWQKAEEADSSRTKDRLF